MTQGVKEWYDLAKMDLGVAKHLEAAYYPKPLEIICFHCQQAAEKGIKAMIMYYDAEGWNLNLQLSRNRKYRLK